MLKDRPDVIARIMSEPRRKLTLPKVDWKTATCEVCGEPFDYMGKRRPHTCQTGECRYKYHYKIEPKTWATYQPTLFDQPE